MTLALTTGHQHLGAPALRAFFRIAKAWELTNDEQRVLLGGPTRQTLTNWRSGKAVAKMNRDLLDRLSYILGIYKALEILFPNSATADGWMKRPHASFEGAPPLSTAMHGGMNDLVMLRRYLDAARG